MCRARSPSLDLLGRRKEEEKKKEKRTIIAFTDTLCEKNVMSLKRVFVRSGMCLALLVSPL